MHCTGSILTKKLILTAGHSFARNSTDFIPKEKLKIVFGINDLRQLDISFIPKIIRNIKEVRFHTSFVWPKAYSDIAILEVYKKVDFNDRIHPVCLPDNQNDDRNHLNGIKVIIVGFGPKNKNSTTMQQISQKIMPYKYCNEKYKRRKTQRRTRLRRLLVKKLNDGFDETLICAKNP